MDTSKPADASHVLLVPSWMTTRSIDVDVVGEALEIRSAEPRSGPLINPDEEVVASPAMLDAFVALGAGAEAASTDVASWDAWADQVAGFARRWGVLGLCEHDLPASHRGDGRIMQMLIAEGSGTWLHEVPRPHDQRVADQRERFPGSPCSPHHRESLSTWLWFTTQARAILIAAEPLRRGEPADDEILKVRSLGPAYMPWMPEELPPHSTEGTRFRFRDDGTTFTSEARSRRRTIRAQRTYLAGVVADWLDLANAALRVTWEEENQLQMGYATSGLFGAIAVDLALKVGDRTGYWLCTHCGSPYGDRKRAPKVGKRHYCSLCKEAGPKAAYRVRRNENGGKPLREPPAD